MTTSPLETIANDLPETKVAHFSSLWVLYYRHGMNPLLTKVFHLDGTLHDAIKYGRKHCEIMGYKYHFMRPLVIDLEAEEAYKQRHGVEPPQE